MNDNDIPIDDGSGKPEGMLSADGHLVILNSEWHETELGKVERWRNQAPDLYEAFMAQTEARLQVQQAHQLQIETANRERSAAEAHTREVYLELRDVQAERDALRGQLSTAQQEIECPLCGETVKQVASDTLSLALSQHVRWVCERGENTYD
jgi:hypothetical protein